MREGGKEGWGCSVVLQGASTKNLYSPPAGEEVVVE